MKLLVFTVFLSTLTSCASLEIKQQSSYNQVHLVKLPRKVGLIENASTLPTRVLSSNEELHSYSHQHDYLSGIKHGTGMTWQKHLFNRGDKSQYFTMDYSHVRRRRPIHNRSINLGP